jgi:hypothetical protein
LDRNLTEDICGTSLRHVWLRETKGESPDKPAATAPPGVAAPAPSAIAPAAAPAESAAMTPAESAAMTPAESAAMTPAESAAMTPAESKPATSTPAAARTVSEPDLAAIAEVSRGGDPVEQIERAELRRAWGIGVSVVVVVLASVLGVLIGTGIIVW